MMIVLSSSSGSAVMILIVNIALMYFLAFRF